MEAPVEAERAVMGVRAELVALGALVEAATGVAVMVAATVEA